VKLEGFLYTDHGQKRRTSEDYKVQQSHIKDLLQQIQTLEKTQPPLFQRMPSSPLSPKDIQEIHAIAIQAKMSTLELEQLIEWEAYSFTRQETDALAAWVHRLVISNGELAPPQRDAHRTSNPYTTALAPRVRVSGYVPEQRLGWHIDELQLFVGYCFGVAPRILATQPLKVPSGKYVETLTVERTQHELISEMAVALSRLPLRTAYAKIVTATPGKESVWMGKIQTFAFEQVFAGIPSGQLIDVSSLAPSTASKAQILKKRSAIEVEIRARQGNWRRRVGNDAPPPQHSDDDSLRSLLAGESGEDCVPSLTPSVPLPPAEEPPPRSEDVSPAQAEIVDVAILIDGVEFAEEPFTITEDAAEPPPQVIPDTPAEEPPETSAIDQSSTGIEERGEPMSPPWHTDEASSSALPVAQSGDDRVPSLLPSVAVDTPDQMLNTPALPFQLEPLRFDESGTAIGTKNDIFIDEIERAEDSCTITEDAAEHQSSSEPPPSTHCVPSPTHEEQPPNTSTTLPASTGTDENGCAPETRLVESGKTGEADTEHHQGTPEPLQLPAPQDHLTTTGETQPLVLVEVTQPTTMSSPEAPVYELPDGVVVVEETFTITEDAAEPPPNQEQQPLATTARKKTPKKVPRAPVPGFKLVSVQFYESGKEYTRQGERQYATHFSKRTARYVNADLVLRNRLYKKRRQTFHVEVRYHNPDGTLFEGTSH
jgi:hypothetical protein